MTSALLWTVVGSVAGVLGSGLAVWQVRLQVLDRRQTAGSGGRAGAGPLPDTCGLPVTVPAGRLPPEVRGRGNLLEELRGQLIRRARIRAWVVAGMGGLGKSTIALAVAESARERGWRVWWVTATDAASFSGGMLEVLRQLGAPETVIKPVRDGAAVAAERSWEFLNGRHLAGRRWLLIFDNADDPAVLAGPGSARPADYAGWLRPDPVGMLIVTTRVGDRGIWGKRMAVRELAPLDDASGANVLYDLAPGVPGPDESAARDLAKRLGGLPLALHLAGSYLASPFARWRTFADYQCALDGVDLPAALADLDNPGAEPRATIQRTWDLSLDALAAGGQPRARWLLLALSCCEPATSIPSALLMSEPLSGLLAPPDAAGPGDPGRLTRPALQALTATGLIGPTGGTDGPAVTVHPVVADVNRARLLTTSQPDLSAVGDAIVRAMAAATAALASQRPVDWPAWRELVPHVSALLRWLAPRLDALTLARLIDLSGPASDALWQSGSRFAAGELARLSTNAARGLGSEHRASLAARHTVIAVLAEEGQYAEAERLYRELLADQQRILGNDHPDTIKTRGGLGWPIRRQGRYAEAEQLYRELLADQQRILGNDHPETLETRYSIARVTGLKGQYQNSERQYRALLADQLSLHRDDHPRMLTARYALALMIGLQGRHAEAEQLCRQVLQDRLRILGSDHPDTLVIAHRLARMIAAQGRYAEAEPLCRQVLANQLKAIGEMHPNCLATRGTLAWMIGRTGRHAEAERLSQELLADQEHILGSTNPDTLQTRYNLAWLADAQQRHQQAEQQCRDLLTIQQHTLGENHPDTLLTLSLLARLMSAQGRPGQALTTYKQVLAGQESILGHDHPDTQATLKEIARLSPLATAPPD